MSAYTKTWLLQFAGGVVGASVVPLCTWLSARSFPSERGDYLLCYIIIVICAAIMGFVGFPLLVWNWFWENRYYNKNKHIK